MSSTLPVILGPNIQLTLTTDAGDISISRHQEITIEETPGTKEINVAASWDDEEVFRRRKAKVTIKGLRGLNNCYSDLPAERVRITGIEFKLVDEDGTAIAGESDLPNLVYAE